MTEATLQSKGELSYPMARGCPFHPPEEYGRLRREEPFSRVRLWDGTSPYLVTSYDDIKLILSHPQFSAQAVNPAYPHVFEGRKEADLADRSFLRMDNPEHDRLRRMVTKEFTVKKINALRPMMQQTVDRLLDAYEKQPQGADFVEHVAAPLPTEVISHLLGVPYEDHEIFHRATRIQFGTKSTPEEVRASLKELFQYLDGLISAKAAKPQDDIISRLVQEQLEPGNVDRETLINIIRLLLSAGHQTTQSMTAMGVLTLLQHPDQLALMRADPELIPHAVEELLRYTTPLHIGARRVAMQDVDINGHVVKKGEGVICATPAANRDETLFPEPDRFDITRNASAHVAFGYGFHQCLGQVLARAELQIVYGTVFQRLPKLRLAVPFEQLRFRHEMFVYGVHELPLAWD
jgi:cytochrome P450